MKDSHCSSGGRRMKQQYFANKMMAWGWSDLRDNHCVVPTFGRFVPLPGGCKVCAALWADEGHGLRRGVGVQVQDPRHALLEAAQVDKLRVGGVRDKMHFWWRRFGWWDLQIILTTSDTNNVIVSGERNSRVEGERDVVLPVIMFSPAVFWEQV